MATIDDSIEEDEQEFSETDLVFVREEYSERYKKCFTFGKGYSIEEVYLKNVKGDFYESLKIRCDDGKIRDFGAFFFTKENPKKCFS